MEDRSYEVVTDIGQRLRCNRKQLQSAGRAEIQVSKRFQDQDQDNLDNWSVISELQIGEKDAMDSTKERDTALADVMRPQGACATDHMERDLNIVVHVQHYENMETRAPANNIRAACIRTCAVILYF
ncbi:hypothetical protein Y1Q_0008195 [Alligator mississippiensis]|uniref:Uncharacterized protein n=1 Tax=Alligator mississippiensis TaxID=8496 RepID=A0A151N1L3_ALLMI|nr:hypothetical protein Y1Q_0008195 [Alligator mississippiensis]